MVLLPQQVNHWRTFDKTAEWFDCEQEMRLSGGMATVRTVQCFVVLKDDHIVSLRVVNIAGAGMPSSPKTAIKAGLATAGAATAEAAVRRFV